MQLAAQKLGARDTNVVLWELLRAMSPRALLGQMGTARKRLIEHRMIRVASQGGDQGQGVLAVRPVARGEEGLGFERL